MEKTLVRHIFCISTIRQYIEYVKNKSVSEMRNATHSHVLLLGFAVQSDTQNPTLILIKQMRLPSIMPDRIDIPENNLNFIKNIAIPTKRSISCTNLLHSKQTSHS